MRRKLLLILALAVLIAGRCCGTALADPGGSCGDNVTWTLNSTTHKLTISGTGAMTDYTRGAAPWYADRDSIRSVLVEDGVTGLGNYSFYGLSNMTSATIPDSVQRIGVSAFNGCFYLIEFHIPNPVAVIENNAFIGCSNLTLYGDFCSTAQTYADENNIPFCVTGSCGMNATYFFDFATDQLTIRGTGPMRNYSSLGVPWYDYRESIKSAVIESGITGIGTMAFCDCTGLTDVTIPNSVTSIGEAAFLDCSGLTGITIPNSVSNIYNSAFKNCSGLTGITIPNRVTSIDHDAFYGCTGLISVTIPDSVVSIGYGAFEGCTGLTSVTIPNHMRLISSSTFRDCTDLTDVTIPNSVTTINNSAFYGCTGLTSITIPGSVTSIDYRAFNNCTRLTGVTVLNPDCAIGDSDYDVFVGCAAGLTLRGYSGSTAEAYAGNAKNPCGFALLAPAPDFFLPSAVKTIEADAFRGIKAKAAVIPKSIQSISGNPFADSDVQYIYGFPGTAAEALSFFYRFIPLTDAWYARLTN